MSTLLLPDNTDLALRWRESSGGLIVPKRARMTGFDLFAGAGGFSLGFLQAGYEIVGALDNDPIAAMTYLSNLGAYPVQIHYAAEEDEERLNSTIERDLKRQRKAGGVIHMPVSGGAGFWQAEGYPPVRHYFFGDVRQFTGKQLLAPLGLDVDELDVLMGGPPCQGFSAAGRRNVMDPRNSLVFEFARLAVEMRPKSLVMENVPGIMSMVTPEGFPVVDQFCRILEDGDYAQYDAMRKALGGHSDARAMLRGSRVGSRKTINKSKPPNRQQSREPSQQTLFQVPT